MGLLPGRSEKTAARIPARVFRLAEMEAGDERRALNGGLVFHMEIRTDEPDNDTRRRTASTPARESE